MKWSGESNSLPLAKTVAHNIKLDLLFTASPTVIHLFLPARISVSRKPFINMGKNRRWHRRLHGTSRKYKELVSQFAVLLSFLCALTQQGLAPASPPGATHLLMKVEFCSFRASSRCCRATICLERSSGVLCNQNKIKTFNESLVANLYSIHSHKTGLTKSSQGDFLGPNLLQSLRTTQSCSLSSSHEI